MSRIDAAFTRLRNQNRKAFVAYVMAGDPDYETSLEIVKGLPEAGVDIIELGIPSPIRWPMARPSNWPVNALWKPGKRWKRRFSLHRVSQNR